MIYITINIRFGENFEKWIDVNCLLVILEARPLRAQLTQVQRLGKHLNTIRTYKPNKHRQIFEHQDWLCNVTSQRGTPRANFCSIVFVLELIKTSVTVGFIALCVGKVKKKILVN